MVYMMSLLARDREDAIAGKDGSVKLIAEMLKLHWRCLAELGRGLCLVEPPWDIEWDGF
jgi:hypothetical protein